MSVKCKRCEKYKAILKRPKTSDAMCKECFFFVFEEEVHKTITDAKIFKRGEKIGIGASGGKGNYLQETIIILFKIKNKTSLYHLIR